MSSAGKASILPAFSRANMNVNEDGVVIDVCQKGGQPNQYQVVSRIGMSKDHAKKFVKKLGEILALTTAHTHTTEKEN